MATEIRVPALGESVTEATIAQWFKSEGEAVSEDEPLVELETEKVTLEVPAPASGVLSSISVKTGETVNVGALLGAIEAGEAKVKTKDKENKAEAKPPKEAPEAKAETKAETKAKSAPQKEQAQSQSLSPAVRKLVEENDLEPADIEGTGKDGRLTKGDVLEHLAKSPAEDADKEPARQAPAPQPTAPAKTRAPSPADDASREERVRMTRLRTTIARRLKDAQNTAAMLTTYNEVDMTAVMGLRSQYKELFEKRHGVKLGFMSFFVKAAIQALREIPAVNAEIDGEEIVYKNYYHIGVAVGTERGLVVPVVRDADKLSLAGIESAIADFGKRAQGGTLKIEEMQGGTFTISNGGVYGSLMSSPILNAPQAGILGMHKIQERPVVLDGKIEARPMMYLALTYDHRLVDGREAVRFLVRLKECLEDPQRLILDL
ncbi:MAG TPA: 2-oxoglutarate dehydrogenase complex dihydrolipoyllysine-residue succinyltransferase [Aestuariivirgaceae bacterium]|nr:2-oxoglutarate dehydrogenase complex dihydrolipoyllysine-residue succinyltransferase [Aestuariivirgaceae bacterium]